MAYFPYEAISRQPIYQLQEQASYRRGNGRGKWPTPIPTRLITASLIGIDRPRIALLGSGGRASEAFQLVKKYPQAEIIGIDADRRAVETAREKAQEKGHKRLTFLEGDVRDVNLLNLLGTGEFSLVLLKGLLTNLLLENDISSVLNVSNQLLDTNGSIVISDCQLGPDEEKARVAVNNGPPFETEGNKHCEYWLARMTRAYTALAHTTIEAQRENLFGTIVIRPYYQDSVHVIELKSQELTDAITSRKFAGFTRHWSSGEVCEKLTQHGFQIETNVRGSFIHDDQEWRVKWGNCMGVFGLQLRATKNSTGPTNPASP